jgi:hypothetical protein
MVEPASFPRFDEAGAAGKALMVSLDYFFTGY